MIAAMLHIKNFRQTLFNLASDWFEKKFYGSFMLRATSSMCNPDDYQLYI